MKIVAYGEVRHKSSDKWEQIVLDQPNRDIPLFSLQREDGERKKKESTSEPTVTNW